MYDTTIFTWSAARLFTIPWCFGFLRNSLGQVVIRALLYLVRNQNRNLGCRLAGCICPMADSTFCL